MNFKPSMFNFLLCLFFVTVNASAQTILSGNVSGTWNIEGNPYLLINDCIVQTGTELIIEPGVELASAIPCHLMYMEKSLPMELQANTLFLER